MPNLIMPGNPRYQPKQLVPFFGYDNLYQTAIEVELANLEVLAELGVIPSESWSLFTPKLKQELLAITTTEVDEIEKKTKHDVRALVQAMQQRMPAELGRFVHIPLTSYDVLDTARILQFRRAYQKVIKPAMKELVEHFIDLTSYHSAELQIGRTHGQHALPITVGFWLATILSRLVYNWERMDQYADQLTGKISGAVGAHNAQLGLNLQSQRGVSYEELVLAKLGLRPALISTQILPPEPLAYFLFSVAMTSASLAQFGEDGRHLMRSEIGEIFEDFTSDAVGSSTMAHKRNPITLEQLVGMWLKTKKEFSGVLDNLLSEHQRDLTGSAPARDYPIILINLQQQINSLLRKGGEQGLPFIRRIRVDQAACQRNFDMSKHLILSEPLYITLILYGYPGDAHEFVNHVLTPEAKKTGESLFDVFVKQAANDDSLGMVLERIPNEVIKILQQPENYIGDAENRSLMICSEAKSTVLRLC